ncbi:signal peptidase I [Lachnospiraceae bacterium]|nr:signal peptidase I [Lachnospiraceae bacterium]BDF39014.1 signal peptidase I [Lachnospiraceae bacterium]
MTGGTKGAPPASLAGDALRLLAKAALLCAAAALLLTFPYGVLQNRDRSMEPSIREGDLVFYFRLSRTYAAGDAVVVEYQGKEQVRRVVAASGDTVDLTEEGLRINGSYQEEPGILGETRRYEDGMEFPATLQEGQVFVLGDSREDAVDSRVYGPVDVSDVCGKVMTILRRRDI